MAKRSDGGKVMDWITFTGLTGISLSSAVLAGYRLHGFAAILTIAADLVLTITGIRGMYRLVKKRSDVDTEGGGRGSSAS